MIGRLASSVALAALAAAATTLQVPHTFSAGTAAVASEVNDNFTYLTNNLSRVYWAPGPTTDTVITATSLTRLDPAPHNVTLASLSLPAGSYLLSGKLSTFALLGGYGSLECALGDPSDPENMDYSDARADVGAVLNMQMPVTLTATTTVTLACDAYGAALDDAAALTTIGVWGSKIMAVKVAAIDKQ
jgi:hypothetical protein